MFLAGVSHRGYSEPLERVLVDFGADNAFGKVNTKLKEHYGILVPESAPRKITLHHALKITELQQEQLGKEAGEPLKCVISETDGSMVPIVKIDDLEEDRRKKKKVCYREARLTLAHSKGSVSPVFSATFKDIDIAGRHIAHCIRRVGINRNTKIHCVGDGAPWISEQIEKQFGSQASYLVDFFHVCEYLASAAPSCTKGDTKEWMEKQKELLKKNKALEVVGNLRSYREPKNVSDLEAPVRACHRYLSKRLHQLDYKSALENDLPIGSGEIESAHRYIVQKRLKITGAWWREENAEQMLALRTNRANRNWDEYWMRAAA